MKHFKKKKKQHSFFWSLKNVFRKVISAFRTNQKDRHHFEIFSPIANFSKNRQSKL